MKVEIVKIDSLTHPKKNVRIHTKEQIKELYKSVEMFGQIRPIIIDEEGLILAGNGLVEAYREHGQGEIKAMTIPGLTESEKKKLMITDNRIYNLGLDHNENIMSILKELDDFNIPGYDEGLLEDLLSEDYDVLVDERAVTDYGVLDEEEIADIEQSAVNKEQRIEEIQERAAADVGRLIRCPHCGKEFIL